MTTTTKRINSLAVGDNVTAVEGVKMERPFKVTEIRTATIKGKTIPVFVILEGGRFWPTGKLDPRTCEIVQ